MNSNIRTYKLTNGIRVIQGTHGYCIFRIPVVFRDASEDALKDEEEWYDWEYDGDDFEFAALSGKWIYADEG